MKLKLFLVPALFAVGAIPMFAQTGAQDGSRIGQGEDSIRCIRNISIYEPYANARQYKDAVE